MTNKLLSKKELAERWGVSPATIDRRIRDKTISPIKNISPIRFSIEHILKVEGVEVNRLSPLERKRLEREKSELEQKVVLLEQENVELKEYVRIVFSQGAKFMQIKGEVKCIKQF